MDTILVFALGMISGSFTSLSIYRIPLKISILFPRSQCPYCHTILQVKDLIPIISYLWLKGKCRYCRNKISLRNLQIEILSAILFVLAYWKIGISIQLMEAFFFIYFLLLIGYIDYDYQLILNKVMIGMFLIGFFIKIICMVVEKQTLEKLDSFYLLHIGIDAFYGCCLGAGFFFLVFIISKGNMGIGDIWFAGVLGFWLGFEKILLTIYLAFLLGGIIGIILILFKIKNRKEYIAFGPFLAIGAWISYLYGVEIICQYQNFMG